MPRPADIAAALDCLTFVEHQPPLVFEEIPFAIVNLSESRPGLLDRSSRPNASNTSSASATWGRCGRVGPT